MKKEKEVTIETQGINEVKHLFFDMNKKEIKRLKIAIWALVIFQVIFVPCVIIAINSLWRAIL